MKVDPKSLTQEQRDFVAGELYDGLRFPNSDEFKICPTTYEGFIAAVNYGLEDKKHPSIHRNGEQAKELKLLHQNLVKSAVE